MSIGLVCASRKYLHWLTIWRCRQAHSFKPGRKKGFGKYNLVADGQPSENAGHHGVSQDWWTVLQSLAVIVVIWTFTSQTLLTYLPSRLPAVTMLQHQQLCATLPARSDDGVPRCGKLGHIYEWRQGQKYSGRLCMW